MKSHHISTFTTIYSIFFLYTAYVLKNNFICTILHRYYYSNKTRKSDNMGIIVNTNSREEYNDKINYYQFNGFKISSSSRMNFQTTLVKKNLGPVWAHIILLVSLIGLIIYESSLVLYPLAITDIFIPLNFFSLLLAVRYLQEIGLILLIIFVIMLIIVLYYYFAKPYEILIKLNQNNNQIINNNNNVGGFNPNRGNFNG